jgi:hypothetical protein
MGGLIMPNWCFNHLTVSVHNESGRKLVQAFKPDHAQGEEKASPFSALYPCPDELMATQATFGNGDPETIAKHEENKEKYGYRHWYEWRLANWGTKWDAAEVWFEHEGDDQVCIRFDTAWSPPTEFFRWYAEQHPDVVFLNQYDEEGCFFEGYECHSPERGFVQESWEPVNDRIPDWEDLVSEIPETEK